MTRSDLRVIAGMVLVMILAAWLSQILPEDRMVVNQLTTTCMVRIEDGTVAQGHGEACITRGQ